MKIAIHIIGIVCFILFSSCKNEIKQDATTAETVTNTDGLTVVDTSAQKYPTWILEFQRLRQALYQNDTDTIKSFFDFPLTDEQADGLKAAVYFNTNIELSKAVRLNTKAELERYCNQIFPTTFVKGLLSLKSDSLVKNKLERSSEWKKPNDNATYYSSALYDEFERTLSLMLNAEYGNKDEETESATVYIFILDKNNKLKFDRIEMAG